MIDKRLISKPMISQPAVSQVGGSNGIKPRLPQIDTTTPTTVSFEPTSQKTESAMERFERFDARRNIGMYGNPNDAMGRLNAFEMRKNYADNQKFLSLPEIGHFNSESIAALGLGDLTFEELRQMAYDGQIEIIDPGDRSRLKVYWANGWNAGKYARGNKGREESYTVKNSRVSPTGADNQQVYYTDVRDSKGQVIPEKGLAYGVGDDNTGLPYPGYRMPAGSESRKAYVDTILAVKMKDAEKANELVKYWESEDARRDAGVYHQFLTDPEFDNYAKIGSEMENPFPSEAMEKDQLEHLTDSELKMYHYLLGKQGKDAAFKYLDYLKPRTDVREGKALAEYVASTRGDHFVPNLEYMLLSGNLALWSGLDQTWSGFEQLLTDEKVDPSSIQYANAYFSKDLEGIDKVAYGIVQQVGSMAPMILTTTAAQLMGVPAPVTAILGSTMVGLPAAGNAYTEALEKGYDKDRAKLYAALVGASEAGLQYLLGGFSGAGGIAADDLLKKVAAWDSAIFRFAGSVAIKGGAEALEENLQNFLEPLFRTMIFGEEYDLPTWEEICYTALVSFFTANLLEGGEIKDITLSGDGTNGVNQNTEIKETPKELAARLINQAVEKVTKNNAKNAADGVSAAGNTQTQVQSEKPVTDAGTSAAGVNVQSSQDAAINATIQAGRELKASAESGNKKAVSELDTAAEAKNMDSAEMRRKIETAYAAGEMTEEEYDSALDALMEQESLEGVNKLDRYNPDMIKTEVNNDGRGSVLDESSERSDGESAGEQAGELAEGTGRDQSGQVQSQRAGDRADRVARIYESEGLQPVTAYSYLGSDKVEDAGQIYDVPQSVIDGDSELSEIVADIRSRGMTPHLFVGEARLKNGGIADAMIRGNDVYIRVDSPEWTAMQNWEHEKFHGILGKSREMIRDLWQQMKRKMPKEKLWAICERYREAYHGIIDVDANGNPITGEELTFAVAEEILADAYAGKDTFGQDVGEFSDISHDAASQIEKSSGEIRGPPDDKAETKAPRDEAQDGKFSASGTSAKADSELTTKKPTDITDDLTADWAAENGYPVINGQQVIPYKTWVLAQDIIRNRYGKIVYDAEGQPKRRHNYGQVMGMAKDGKLLVSFRNKRIAHKAIGEDLQQSNVPIAVADLTPVEAKYQHRVEDWDSLEHSEPENINEKEFTEEELQEIEKLFNKAWMEEYPLDKVAEILADPVAMESITGKNEALLRSAENKLLRDISEVLGVPYLARKDYLDTIKSEISEETGEDYIARKDFMREVVREISVEYMETGTVSEATLDTLFDKAYDQGIVVDKEFFDKYKDLGTYLKDKKITVSESEKESVPDLDNFKKRASGTLSIVKKDGVTVAEAYRELHSKAPELFPDSIDNPAEQLKRMLEAGRSIRKAEQSTEETSSIDEEAFRSRSEFDFKAKVHDHLAQLRLVKRYALEQHPTGTAQKSTVTLKDLPKLYDAMKAARRAVDKAMGRNVLTESDNMQVSKLLRGDINESMLNPLTDNVNGILEVFRAKAEYEKFARQIRRWNAQRKEKLYTLADKLLENAHKLKDKSAGWKYSRETMERNIRDMTDDKDLAEKIIDEMFTPVHKAAAKAAAMKNEYRDRVRALKLSRKVAAGNKISEAAAVQLLGEAEDNIQYLQKNRFMKERDGKTLEDWSSIVRDLWESNPNLDAKKIRDAVSEFRYIYDELFEQMNEVRMRNGYEPINYRKGYFPHFQSESGDGILSQFGKSLGINTAAMQLPTAINGMTHTFKSGIQWVGSAQQRKGVNTSFDAVEGFDSYIEGVADVICQTDNIQRLRAFATQVRYRTSDEGLRKQVDAVKNDPTIAEEDKQNRIKKIYENGKFELGNFAVELDEYTNLLAGKKSRHDRDMEQRLGRKWYAIMKAAESRVAANMVAVNPGSWLTNFIPITQGWATLDSKSLLAGMWDTLRAYKNDDGMVERSTFLTNRRGSDPIVRTWAQETSAVLSKPMELIDSFTADTLVRARFNQNVRRGMSEEAAMADADAWAAGVMADRSKGAMPTIFAQTNPITKLFTQFQLEVNNQLSYVFKDIPREMKEKGAAALAIALLKFMIGAYLFDELYEYFIGRRPALDPLGIVNDTVGDLTGYELPNLVDLSVGVFTGDMPSFEVEKKGVYDAGLNLAGSVVEDLPFVGGLLGGGRLPINSALPDVGKLWQAASDDSWAGEKRFATAAKELAKPAAYILPPFGGGQVKKAVEGLETVIRGGSYSVDNTGADILQYSVANDTFGQAGLNAISAMLFGKSSLGPAREWVESGFDSLSAKQTELFDSLREGGASTDDAYGLIRNIEAADTNLEKISEVANSYLDEWMKELAMSNVMSDSQYKKYMDARHAGVSSEDYYSFLQQIESLKAARGSKNVNQDDVRSALDRSSLTNSQKRAIWESYGWKTESPW